MEDKNIMKNGIQKEQRTKKEQSAREKKASGENSKSWTFFEKINTIVAFISGLVTIAGIVFVYIEYNNAQKERVEVMKEKAILMFNDAQYERAYEIFSDLKALLPNDTVGYSMFYHVAYEQWKADSCKNVQTKKYLKRAIELHPISEKNEANKLLEKYESCLR